MTMNENKNNVSPVSQTPDRILKDKLKQLIPEAFSEGKLNIDTLKAVLGESVLTPSFEAYGLNWAGKHKVYGELKAPTSQTLLPQPDESVDFDNTQNLFIEGDNLAVLKILQKSYYNRIKMIYIDPPYNTGNDRFIYPDDYSESIKAYKERAGQTDDEGNLTHSDGMRSNSKENGQYHSNWLNMMYPRLALAKNLLRDDGVIFVSIGVDEIANLKLVMDEIFGEDNKIAIVSRLMKSGGAKGNFFTPNIDYIAIYARDISRTKYFRTTINPEQIDKYYKLTQAGGKRDGERYGEERLYKASLDIRANQRYWIECPDGSYVIPPGQTFPEPVREGQRVQPIDGDGVWKWIYDRYKQEKQKDNIVFKLTSTSPLVDSEGNKSKWNIYNKLWLNEQREKGKVPSDFLGKFENRQSAKELSTIDLPFDYAKPVSLIKYLISIIDSDRDDIILDFFAGSSTTAHAVMALNAEEANNGENNSIGKRKFIMVQIPEDVEEDSEAYKAGFSNIADISKERIRRAGQQILADNPDLKDSNLDIGFKTYKLSDSNFVPWQQLDSYDAESLLAQLEKHVNPIVDDATDSGLVTELMLKEGYKLTANIEQKDGFYIVTQDNASLVDNDVNKDSKTDAIMTLAVVLENMTTDKANQIIQLEPSKTIILDNAFSDDANKANIVLQFEDAGLVVGCV